MAWVDGWDRAWAPPEQVALVFNCQMGRGRTTTGMIIASLLHLHHRGRIPGTTPVPASHSSAPQTLDSTQCAVAFLTVLHWHYRHNDEFEAENGMIKCVASHTINQCDFLGPVINLDAGMHWYLPRRCCNHPMTSLQHPAHARRLHIA